jgi:hypothetical protein
LEVSDENAGLYILISDLYAMVGRWDDAINIRRLVRERNVKKNKGFSTIKVDEPLARTGSFFLQGKLQWERHKVRPIDNGILWQVKAPPEMKIVSWRLAHKSEK